MTSVPPTGGIPPKPPQDESKESPDQEKFSKVMQDEQGLSPFEKNLMTKYGFKISDIKKFRKLMLQTTMYQINKDAAKMTEDIKKMFKDDE